MTTLSQSLPAYGAPLLTDLAVIAERHDCRLAFHVMPGRPVAETLHFERYEVSADYARNLVAIAGAALAAGSRLLTILRSVVAFCCWRAASDENAMLAALPARAAGN